MDGFIERISVLQQPLGELLLVVQNYSVHWILTSAAKNRTQNSSSGDMPTASIATLVQVQSWVMGQIVGGTREGSNTSGHSKGVFQY